LTIGKTNDHLAVSSRLQSERGAGHLEPILLRFIAEYISGDCRYRKIRRNTCCLRAHDYGIGACYEVPGFFFIEIEMRNDAFYNTEFFHPGFCSKDISADKGVF